MKRAQQQEEKCRRMEFKCKLYGIIKDLDRSLKSECGQWKPPPGHGGGFGNLKEYTSKQKQLQGSECCCPPGCCQQSMEFRMPRLLHKEEPAGAHDPAEAPQDPHGTGTGHLVWHNEDHSWGCRPVGEGGPGSQRGGGGPGYDYAPDMPGRNPDYGGAARTKCGEGSSDFGGGCCTYKPLQSNGNPNSSPAPFQFPQSPEEAMQRGCFVARSA